MWKYIEGKDEAGKPIDMGRAREFFGVHDDACPSLELANGMFAVWCAAPRSKPAEYDELSHAPKGDARAAGFRSVK